VKVLHLVSAVIAGSLLNLSSGATMGGRQQWAVDARVFLVSTGPLEGTTRYRVVARLLEAYFVVSIEKLRFDEESGSPEVLLESEVPPKVFEREAGELVTDFDVVEWQTSRSLAIRVNERRGSLAITEKDGSIVASVEWQ
jgi:hypothetical protein